MSRRKYQVLWAAAAKEMLAAIPDRRIQKKIVEKVRGLSAEPEKQGKPLLGQLAGYRSLRAAGQRYRIIFRVENDRVLVLIVALGIRKEADRKDIYSLARKLVRLGLVETGQGKKSSRK